MSKAFIAHVRHSDNKLQSVEEHLLETAEIAKWLARKLGLELAGELLGLMHDFGKYSKAFQEYIKAVTGVNPDVDLDDVLPGGGKIDHSAAGAQWVYRYLVAVMNCQHALGQADCFHHHGAVFRCLVWRRDARGEAQPSGDVQQKSRIRKAFDVALARDCDVNAVGLSSLNALHLAVIKGDGELV